MDKKNIGVIGVGKLGLSFALLCAHKGLSVTASDKDFAYIDRLKNNSHKTTEPHIEEYLLENNDIIFTTNNRMVVESSDIIFLFVPTPSKENGEYDHQYIEQAIESIHDMDISGKILVIGCTTMPGYCESLEDRLIEKKGVTIVYNPEFIAQGDIIGGLKRADMVLVGTNSHVAPIVLQAIYRTIMDIPLNMKVMSPTAAEITKISINCYLTMKIAYANMIGEIVINSGIEDEVPTVLTAIGSDSRIGNKYLGYGFGYGGPCLPRDMRALGIHANNNKIYTILPLTIDDSNNMHHNYLVRYCKGKNPDKNTPFIFPQLSYKKGVNMTVESQQLRLAIELQKDGYQVYTTDTIQTNIPQLPANTTGYTVTI